MVSSKERLRLAREFDVQARHIANQKNSIDRLLALAVVQGAALYEISSMLDNDDIKDESVRTGMSMAVERAKRGLEEAAALMSPEGQSKIDGESGEDNASE